MTNLAADVRFAARMLRKHPLTTAAAVLSLALGIGGTTAIFSVFDTVLLRPLPYADPDRLVAVWASSRQSQRGDLSPGDFVDFRRESRSFESLAAIRDASMSLTGAGDPEQVRVHSVSGNFLTLLGARAIAGRTFLPADDEEGPWDRVMLSEGLWKRRYGGRTDIVGATVTLGGTPMEVVGVLPSSFRFERPADVWLLGRRGIPRAGAVPGDLSTNRDVHILQVIGKLAPGVPLAVAQAELDGHAARLALQFPQTNAGYGVVLDPLHTALVGDTRPLLAVLLGAVTVLLLIAAANVANLMLVRTGQRTVELTMRSALGASRGRLLVQILVEAVLLACVGGVLGVAVAGWGVTTLVGLAPRDLPRLDEVSVDGRLLAAGFILTLITGGGFGLWPAWRASRATVAAAAAGGQERVTAGRHRRRAQQLLVGGELALAQVLLVAAGLLVASFARLLAVDPGFTARDIVTVDLSLAAGTYGADPARKAQFHELVLERAAALPGVEAAAMSLTPPLSGAINRGVVIEGRPALRPGERQTMSFMPVSESYFDLIGLPVRRGRPFSSRDSAAAERVVIVNEAFVRRYLGSADPLTQRVGFGNPDAPNYWRRVVAIVGDARERIGLPAAPTAYIPFRQDLESWNFASYEIRTSLPTAAVAASMQRVVLGIARDQPISRARALHETMAEAVAVERFTTLMAGLFAGLALVLAAVGAFGVMSHVVGARRRELGVRLALGARNRDITRLVLFQSLRTVGCASAVGLAGAFLAGRSMSALLYQVRPGDPPTIAAAVCLLFGTALMATYLPVRRALAANPIASLRNE
jgi:putative ABC transport system permease protein